MIINTIKRDISGIKRYYKREGREGVIYYIKHRIYNTFIKPLKHSNLFTIFDAERILAKRFENTIQKINEHDFEQMGNYFVSKHCSISPNSVIYSLGVLSETSFDEAIHDKFGCPIYLFDPSNIARDHLNKLKHPHFLFSQVGVWKETCEVEFSTPKYGGSPSMVLEHNGKRFTHQCVDVKEILENNQHSHVDILKLDIEGAAIDVINRFLELSVYPTQIIAEFERPRKKDITEYFTFYIEVISLMNRLFSLGYTVHLLPREKFNYFSIELIFIRENR